MQVSLEHETQEGFAPYIGDEPEGYSLMATALVYFFSDDSGFVVAADGRNTCVSAEGQVVVSDDAQKIFPVHGIGREAVFSFLSRIALYDQTESHIAFDFTSQFDKASKDIQANGESFRDADDFLSRVCSVVQERLEITKRDVGLSKYSSKGRTRLRRWEHAIVSIHLDGYFPGRPVRAGAEFYHIDQEVQWDINSAHTLECPRKRWNTLQGSKQICHLLFDTDDVRLAEYRTDACKRIGAKFKDSDVAVTLQDSIEAAKNYIAACSSGRWPT
jgi:hypothetical protein